MKNICGVLGILAVALGTVFGLVNWWITEFYFLGEDWSESVVLLNRAMWLLNILAFGTGGMLIGIASLLKLPAPQQPQPYSSPDSGPWSS